MLRRRLCHRYTKRLEVTFTAGDQKYRGISSDLSAGGLFIRTQNGFKPGTIIDITLYLPDNKTCPLTGIVRRTVKTPLSLAKSGMGIELIERDPLYLDFIRTFASEEEGLEGFTKPAPAETGEEDETLPPSEKTAEKPRPETSQQPETKPLIVTCHSCNAKNRVNPERLSMSPRCGRCGTALRVEGLG